MRPIISYYGGKQRMAPRIVPLIPKHTVYVEPFCGGASILFAKDLPPITNATHYREILNDTDERLITLYREMQNNGGALIEKLKLTPHSESEYHRSAHVLRNPGEFSTLDRAWAYFVNSQQSFSNTLLSGWGRGVYSRNLAATWNSKLLTLDSYLARMSKVHIACQPALKCIKQFDSPQTLFYCDPPYPGSNQGHYGGYTIEDFKALWDTLAGIQGSFLLSCYGVGFKTPDGWEKFEFKAHCSASRKGKVNADKMRAATREELGNRGRTEIVYRKINARVRPEIQKIYDSGKLDCFVSVPDDNQDWLGVSVRSLWNWEIRYGARPKGEKR